MENKKFKYKNLLVEISDNIATVWLNRPEAHNSLNEEVISEISDCFDKLQKIKDIQLVIFRGKGRSFCAGADINWMRSVSEYDFNRNKKESRKLAKCFYKIYSSEIPVVGIAHGACMGGGIGLLSACSVAFCTDNASFAFSEVKLGLVPATIAPYIIKRIGEFKALELMLTGEKLDGKAAERFGLVNKSLPDEDIETHLTAFIERIKQGSPYARRKIKELIFKLSGKNNFKEIMNYTSELIAKMRISDDGQEGLSAFLEKRKPLWHKVKK